LNADLLLRHLNPPQAEAVRHVTGPLLILAGPGSGKTRVVTHRIAYLLEQGVRGREMVALTFTNKAADEMRRRVVEITGGPTDVWLGTFHRFCARLLRRYAEMAGLKPNYSILDVEDSRKILKEAARAAGHGDTRFTPEQIASAISSAKNELIAPDMYEPCPGDPIGNVIRAVYPEYERRLLASNAVDFDDLLLHIALLLRNSPELRQQLDAQFKYVMVDEYQDTNLAQYAIVRALSVDYPNLAVTGDPDQSIYGWRGANIRNILDFEHDFPKVKVVRLEQNYRSTGRILCAADQLIANNTQRKKKSLFTENPEGEKVRLVLFPDYQGEAEGIADGIQEALRKSDRRPGDFAIFYRTTALSRTIEHSLRERGIPYQIVNGTAFYNRKEIKDAMCYLRLINNPADSAALERVINTPARGIGKKSLELLFDFADEHLLTRLEAAQRAKEIAGLSKKAVNALIDFARLYELLVRKSAGPLAELMRSVVEDTGYRKSLQEASTAEDEERIANLDELISAAREFEVKRGEEGTLESFLEQSALMSDVDIFDGAKSAVTLMTLHAAKGLEFPCVFIIGLEQGLLPHQRAVESGRPEQLEEERRLLFVGITRAREELTLSLAQRRGFRGGVFHTIPSGFLMELPRSEFDMVEVAGWMPRRRAFTSEGNDDFHADDSHEEVIIVSGEEPSPISAPVAKPVRSIAPLIQTASAMLGDAGSAAAKSSWKSFRQGMMVSHPEYGIGSISLIEGREEKTRATVRFIQGGQERKFMLAMSPLQPLGGGAK
jgi:DNA helicase-2/ATP-dependent DNA helicase PcrA